MKNAWYISKQKVTTTWSADCKPLFRCEKLIILLNVTLTISYLFLIFHTYHHHLLRNTIGLCIQVLISLAVQNLSCHFAYSIVPCCVVTGTRGHCVCGECVCEADYTGTTCECPTTNLTCIYDNVSIFLLSGLLCHCFTGLSILET